MEGIEGVDPVSPPGLHGAAGEDLTGEVWVDGTQLGEDGQQNGVVSGVAPAVGSADDHLIPALLLIAENGLVDLQLALDGGLDGEFRLGLFIQPPAHGLTQGGVPGQGQQVSGQCPVVPGGEEKAVGSVVDEIGHAAHLAAHSGQPRPGALGQRVGEGLRNGGEGVDVQGVVEGVGVAEIQPAKHTCLLDPQLCGQTLQRLSISSPSPAMSSRRAGKSSWARAKPRMRVEMSLTGLSRAAMPTTTEVSSASRPTERK